MGGDAVVGPRRRIARATTAALAISDVVMPGMSGPEFVEQLQRVRPDVRVLFVSGYTDDEVMRRGVLTGTTAFLQKPFTPDQLQKIREVMTGNVEPIAPS